MPCPNPSRLRNRSAAGLFCIGPALDRDARLRRIRYRAWHRGTRESDFLVGGYFDRCSAGWSEADFAWFEALLDEQDADIIAWVIGTLPVPDRYAGPMMERMRQTDYIDAARDGA
jgi:antitoxin CptB